MGDRNRPSLPRGSSDVTRWPGRAWDRMDQWMSGVGKIGSLNEVPCLGRELMHRTAGVLRLGPAGRREGGQGCGLT